MKASIFSLNISVIVLYVVLQRKAQMISNLYEQKHQNVFIVFTAFSSNLKGKKRHFIETFTLIT